MPRIPIETSPLGLAKYSSLVRGGHYLAAARFVVKHGYAVAPHLFDAPHLEALAALERRNPIRAAAYATQFRQQIAEAREARELLADIDKGGPGLTRDEIVTSLRDGPAPGWSVTQRIHRLHELGERDAAEVVRARHPAEVVRERASARQAEEARAARDRAIQERAAPRAREALDALKGGHREQLAALDSKFRDTKGEVHRAAPAYLEKKKAIDDSYETEWQKQHASIRAAAEAEVDGAQPEPPRAA